MKESQLDAPILGGLAVAIVLAASAAYQVIKEFNR